MFRKFAPCSISMPLKRFFAKYFDILVCLLSFGGLFKQTACFTIRILIEFRLEYKSVFFLLKHDVAYLNFINRILAFVHLMTLGQLMLVIFLLSFHRLKSSFLSG